MGNLSLSLNSFKLIKNVINRINDIVEREVEVIAWVLYKSHRTSSWVGLDPILIIFKFVNPKGGFEVS